VSAAAPGPPPAVPVGAEPDALRALFHERGYVAGDELATALHLALALGKPLLLEGPAGVGKTEAAKVLADALGRRLIRLQCYEGLDAAAALYEWNYPRQLLWIRLTEQQGSTAREREAEIFGEEFLLTRPLLQAIREPAAPVLLIDEVDRADEAFEAFLLEVLGEWQVTVPELGTISAVTRPAVVVTSNRSRELSDALRRRCLYLWLEYPTVEQEVAILRARLPGISERLAQQIAQVMAVLRSLPMTKAPGVAESLDWATALLSLHRDALDPPLLDEAWSCIVKVHEDRRIVAEARPTLVEAIEETPPGGGRVEAGGHGLSTDFGIGSVSVRD
jgi:MoxR-like ATPase